MKRFDTLIRDIRIAQIRVRIRRSYKGRHGILHRQITVVYSRNYTVERASTIGRSLCIKAL